MYQWAQSFEYVMGSFGTSIHGERLHAECELIIFVRGNFKQFQLTEGTKFHDCLNFF